MSYYTDDPHSVRVDFFKKSGKWYVTEAVIWKTYKGSPTEGGKLISDAFAEALVAHLRDPETGKVRLMDMTAVCLEPYHEHAHPQMMAVERAVGVVDGTVPKYKPVRA